MIQVEEITRNYGDFVAIDKVSFEISRGEIVGFLGHNGAGKTTVMKMLTGFLEPTSGTIRVDGLDIEERRSEVQEKIGYLPENCPIYPEMTVIDYLEFTADLHGVPQSSRLESVRKAIYDTDLAAKAAQPINTLSRGYRQRVGVAQAILHAPQILILDEPTSGLDPSQIRHMRDLIKRLAETSTVILSTHILQEVQAICDRVIIINKGQLALDTRLANLRASNRLLVCVDAGPDAAALLFSNLDRVESMEHLGTERDRHDYVLTISGVTPAGDALDAAPLVARAIHDTGIKLYALHREQRDLELVFATINSAKENLDVSEQRGVK